MGRPREDAPTHPSARPSADRWYSAPNELRHRLEARWTLPRALIAHVRAEAAREGIAASALVERALVAQLGEPPPLPDSEPVKENRPAT